MAAMIPWEHEAATARCKIGASARQTESAPIDTMKLTETSLGRFPRRYPSDPRVACTCGHSFRALVAVPRDRRSGQPDLDSNHRAGRALAVRFRPRALDTLGQSRRPWRCLGAPRGTLARLLSRAIKPPAAPESSAVQGALLGSERVDRYIRRRVQWIESQLAPPWLEHLFTSWIHNEARIAAGEGNRFGERIVTLLSRLEVKYPRLLSRCDPWFDA